MKTASTLPNLVFSDQLFADLFALPRQSNIYLLEDPFIFSAETPKPRLVFYRAALQAVREHLLWKGCRVHYCDAVHYPDLALVAKRLRTEKVRVVDVVTLPAAKSKAWKKAADEGGITVHTKRTPGWKPGELPSSEAITLRLPPLWKPKVNRYVEEAVHYVTTHFPDNPGIARALSCPVTHADAEDYLEDFLKKWFPLMGKHRELPFFASYLPQLLEAGLLTPKSIKKTAAIFPSDRAVSSAAVRRLEALLH